MYELYIANKNYSSWSLRPWVLLTQLGIAFEEKLQVFGSQDNFEQFRVFSPTGRVPCLIDAQTAVWDSLAIVEYLAERHDGVWPSDATTRTYARCAAAEMHSGFSEIRNVCPMNCAITVEMGTITPGLQRDIDRIDELWCEGLDRFGGPFLAGKKFSAADAFFCPVAYRVTGYQLPLSEPARKYAELLMSMPAMRQWDASAIIEPWREQSHEDEAGAAGRIVLDRRTR